MHNVQFQFALYVNAHMLFVKCKIVYIYPNVEFCTWRAHLLLRFTYHKNIERHLTQKKLA